MATGPHKNMGDKPMGNKVMLTRRTLLATSAAGLAAPARSPGRTDRGPFAFLPQSAEVDVLRNGVSGLEIGVLPDYTHYARIVKA